MRVMQAGRVPPEHEDLFGIRTDTPYTAAERRYSAAVQARLEELLAGKRRQVTLMRRYHRPDGEERVAVLPAPAGIDRSELRLAVVERILVSAIAFVRDVSPGGPVFQQDARGELVEVQHFSTKFPHIVIERVDSFSQETREPLSTEWRLRRTQNQRVETQINRWLDLANLALGVLDRIGGGRRR